LLSLFRKKPFPDFPSSERITSLEELVSKNTENHTIQNSLEPKSGEYLVTDVASGSIADRAGIEPGDIVVSVENENPDLENVYLYQYLGKYQYKFYSPEDEKLISFTTFGGPIGIKFEKSSDSFSDTLSGHELHIALDVFWKRREWATLRKCLDKHGVNEGDPTQLLHGAWLYETKGPAFGTELIEDFMENHAQSFVTHFHAIGYYYMALEHEKLDNKEIAEELLQLAFSFYQIPIIEDAYIKITGKSPEKPCQFLEENFPDYIFPSIIKPKKKMISLSDTLSSMNHNQLLLIASMPEYRVNGVYYELVRNFTWFAYHFPMFIADFHVIVTNRFTEFRDKKFHKMWIEAEQDALRGNYPIKVILDEEKVLSDKLQNTITPTEYLLDSSGRVVHQGPIDNYDWWNALSRAK